MRDANLSVKVALPVGAVTVVSPSLAIGPITSKGDYEPSIESEFLLEAPALAVGALPNATTVTYDIVTSPNADLSSSTVLSKGAIIQTGAGGVGAAAASIRYNPPSNVLRYLGFQATGVATVAASGSNGVMTYVR